MGEGQIQLKRCEVRQRGIQYKVLQLWVHPPGGDHARSLKQEARGNSPTNRETTYTTLTFKEERLSPNLGHCIKASVTAVYRMAEREGESNREDEREGEMQRWKR